MDLTPEREHRSFPKGRTRRQVKAKKDRAEAAVKKDVRSACVERDGYCRYDKDFSDWLVTSGLVSIHGCGGPLEWAHLHVKRRSQTRGQAPEIRHTTQDSLMLCRVHHDQYDGRAQPRLLITALTSQGADGPLKFRTGR